MAVGMVSTRILTDIANAICRQNGTSASYKPREMAAAVSALDGTKAGEPGIEEYKGLETGVLSSKVFDAIGAAIRGQNGLEARYAPADMAAAILALEWDTGLKVRALLLDNGRLEFNYLDGRRSAIGGTILQSFAVDAVGYASADSRPWKDIRTEVRTVYLHSSLKAAGITNFAYRFNGFSNLRLVLGFESLSRAEDVTQLFTSCGELRTVSASSFDNSKIKKYASVLYGCSRLVGGADGFVPSQTSGASVLKLGTGGVLTDPEYDVRTWLNATLFADGELEIGFSKADTTGREVLASDTLRSNAKYTAIQATPWAAFGKSVKRVTIAADTSRVANVNLNYWFYSCNALTSVSGMSNLHGVVCMNHTFNSCSALTELDLRGMSPASLSSLLYTFGACTALERILVDADWELPSECTGSSTFYNCKAIVDGNGTTYDSKQTTCAMCRIDREGQAGYLTAG